MKAFQSLFPSLSPQTLTLSSARRVVLVAYNPDRGTIDFRHYIITVKPYGVSKRVRRVLEGVTTKSSSGSVLDLGNERDVADFLLRKRGEPGPDGGYESAASSAESVAGDDGDAVNLAGDYVGRNNKKGQHRAIRLDEVGPRLELRLVKITEGVPGKEGAVIYHEFGELASWFVFTFSDRHAVKKSKKQVSAQNAAHAAKEKLRKERREEQERNVARKKAQAGDVRFEDEDADDEVADVDAASDEDAWDGEEEISEGEESEADEPEDSSEEEEEVRRPNKKVKVRGKG